MSIQNRALFVEMYRNMQNRDVTLFNIPLDSGVVYMS